MRDVPQTTQLLIYAPAVLPREAWRALLADQPGILVSGVMADPNDLAAHLQPDRPTTLLIDLPIPQPDLARQIRYAAPDLGLLFLVPSYDLFEIVPLLQAGASGCVSRDDSVGDLARAIIAAGRGEIVLPAAIAAHVLAALAQAKPVGPAGLIEPLSDREAEVLRLLAHGLTNKDIAQTLILSVRTIDAHLRTIFGKLAVHSRTEAVLWAVKHGYGPQK